MVKYKTTSGYSNSNPNLNRRDFIRLNTSALILGYLSNLVGNTTTYAAQKHKDPQIQESNKKTKKRIQERTFSKDDRTYLRISDLVNLEIVDPNTTGVPEEYVDPLNTGVPLVRIQESDLDKKVTEDFRLREYALIPTPKHNEGIEIPVHTQNEKTYHEYIRLDPQLVELMQKLRSEYGDPINIKSPYRNATYNKKVGGKVESRHRTGQAADIADINGNNLAEISKIADKLFSEGGLGKYKTFTHVDARGFRARW